MNFKTYLIAFTSVWFLLCGAILFFIEKNQSQLIQQSTTQQLHRDLAKHMRDDLPLLQGTEFNPEALKNIFHTLMLLGPDFEIYFLNQQGIITTHAAPQATSLTERVDLRPIKRFLSGQPLPILGTDPKSPSQLKVFSVAPITSFNSTVGYLYVVIGSSRHGVIAAQQANNHPNTVLIAMVIFSILGFAIGVYLLIKRNLLSPIQYITEQLQEQVNSGFKLHPKLKANCPELLPILSSYQQMAHHIQQQFLQLQYQESHRRQTLLQLSHDLKTPLSSVLGYLETWQLQPGNNNPLIDVAHRNSVKLSKQLQSMLTQAKQQAPMPRYHYVPLNLEQLIKQCIENIAPQFHRRQIELNIEAESGMRIIGDKELLERLLNNLFDNALRHSPKGGKVTCQAKRVSQQGLIEFSIENNIDIHADKGSLGLGINIVQSILMLHHSHLQTEQTPQYYRQRFCLLSA